MATKDKQEETKTASKKSIPTKKYPLIKDTSIGGEIVKKGDSVSLTEKGRKQFKKEGKIK